MTPTTWKRAAARAAAAAILISAPAAVYAGGHPHYLPPQISSYPSAEAPSSGQSSEQEKVQEKEECPETAHSIFHGTISENETCMTGGLRNDHQL